MTEWHTVTLMTDRHDNPAPGYLPKNDAAAALRVSERTLERYARAGVLTKYRTGTGRVYFLERDVLALAAPTPVGAR